MRSERKWEETRRQREQNLTSCLSLQSTEHICLPEEFAKNQNELRGIGKSEADMGGIQGSHARGSRECMNRLSYVVFLHLARRYGCLFWPERPERALWDLCRRLCQEEQVTLQAATRRGELAATATARRQRNQRRQGKRRRWLLRCRLVSGMPHMLKPLALLQLGVFLPSPKEPRKMERLRRLLCAKPYPDSKKPASDDMQAVCGLVHESQDKVCPTCMKSKDCVCSGLTKLACVCFRCLKLIIPGGKLSLQSKYTECFVYNFTVCLDHKVLRLLSLPYNIDRQAHSWLILSDFCVNWEAANEKRKEIGKTKGLLIFYESHPKCAVDIMAAPSSISNVVFLD